MNKQKENKDMKKKFQKRTCKGNDSMNLIYTKSSSICIVEYETFFVFKCKSIKLVPWVQNPHTYKKHNCKYAAYIEQNRE